MIMNETKKESGEDKSAKEEVRETQITSHLKKHLTNRY